MAGSVLITGAAGFVGRSVARVLSARGFRVTGLDRAPPARSARTDEPAFAAFSQCDLLDDEALARIDFEGDFDAVVHLAGVLPGRAPRREVFAVNVGGTSAVLDRLARPGCHLVFFSTGLVYGAQPGPFREDMDCLPAEPYGQSKLAGEALVGAFSRATDSPLTVFRPSVLYGPGAPPGMLLVSMLEALRKQEPFAMTAGEQLRDFLYVDDAAEAVAAVIEQRAAGTWNLASGDSQTVRQAAEIGAAIAKRPDLLKPGELPYRANEVFDYRLDADALQRAVGFRPRVGLAAGLQRMWEELS